MINIKKIFRSILRERLNSGIIIISLAIGLACINLIANFIVKELSADKFHKDSDRIFALQIEDPWYAGKRIGYTRAGSAEYMKENFSQVKDFCRISHNSVPKLLVNKELFYDNPIVLNVSGNFFEFFSYRLLYGDPESVLNTKNDIVISEQFARKFFGNSNVIGQTIDLFINDKTEQMIITGVFQKPLNSTQLKFDMLRLAGEMDGRCFVKLSSEASVNEVEKLFEENKAKIPIIYIDKPGQYFLQSLSDNYFDSSRGIAFEKYRDKQDLKIALVIALIIMLVAFFNYVGLLNNSLLGKHKDHTIQMINGGSKWIFMTGIMTENLILIIVSFLAAIPVMLWMIPFFNNLTNSDISAGSIFQFKQLLISGLIITVLLITTFLFVLSKLHSKVDLKILKSQGKLSGKKVQMPVFNIFQLASTIALIICSLVIIKQNRFVSNKPIGMNKDVIEVKIPPSYGKLTKAFKEELESYPSIDRVSVSNSSPLLGHMLILLFYKENGVEKQYCPAVFAGDENYLSALEIKLVEGEGFTGNPGVDRNRYVINRSLAKMFPGQNLIGKQLPGGNKVITGIVEDFHYSDLKSKIEPAYIAYNDSGRNLLIKASANQFKQANEAIFKVWSVMIPDYPLNIQTVGERYLSMHHDNKNYIYFIGSCSAISIFLSMIGLFTVSYLDSRVRIREIGVRKVNGASSNEILTLLNKDYIKWVVIAFIIASPVTWYLIQKWLENFAYRTELNWWIFALAGFMALCVSLVTVSWKSWMAARKNPLESLRYE